RVKRPLWIDRSTVLRAPATGVWHPAVEKMQAVGAGTLIGRLTDLFGKPVSDIRAPFAGQILYVVTTPPVTEGEPLAGVARIAERMPPDLPGAPPARAARTKTVEA